MKLGLFGGSFDPVHEGHVLMAHAALEELSLNRLCFIPAAQSPLKPDAPPAPGAVRTAMLRTALAGEPRFSIDDQELVRGGISYTIDTVRAFLAASPGVELFYMIGADHVPVLPKWREADQLAKLVEFIVVPRPGEEPQPFPAPFRGRVLKGFPLGVSSSQIRARVKAGLSIQHLVPQGVPEIIRNNRLYL